MSCTQEVPGGDVHRRGTGKGNKNIHITGLQIKEKIMKRMSFPGGSDGKEYACSARDVGLIPGLRRSPGQGNASSLQYSCLENPMNRGAWWTVVHGLTTEQQTQ